MSISKKELQSPEFLAAFNVAMYAMRKNARYETWSLERRQQKALGIAYDVVEGIIDPKLDESLVNQTRAMIKMKLPRDV